MINVCIINESTALKDSQIELILPFLQKQVSEDFLPAWGIDCKLSFGKTDGAWQLIVLDDSDQADALGYHDFTSDGFPIGKVFAGTDIKNGNSWMVTLSHELLEMLVDPEINLCAENDGKLWAYEVCDPVEDDGLAYRVGEVLLSDFVYPSWFSPNGKAPYDKAGHVSAPFQLGPGGYASTMRILGLGWSEQSSSPTMARRAAPVGSRRERRKSQREWLKRSVR